MPPVGSGYSEILLFGLWLFVLKTVVFLPKHLRSFKIIRKSFPGSFLLNMVIGKNIENFSLSGGLLLFFAPPVFLFDVGVQAGGFRVGVQVSDHLRQIDHGTGGVEK